MKVDFKLTIWESFDIPEEYSNREEELSKAIKEGQIVCQQDLEDFFGGSSLTDGYELYLDTEKYISPNFNQDGFATVELVDDNGFVISDNSKS